MPANTYQMATSPNCNSWTSVFDHQNIRVKQDLLSDVIEQIAHKNTLHSNLYSPKGSGSDAQTKVAISLYSSQLVQVILNHPSFRSIYY